MADTIRVVTKNLICQEDLALGRGSVTQTRDGSSLTLTRFTPPIIVDNVDALKAIDVTATDAPVYVDTAGFGDYLDGNYRKWIYDPNRAKSTADGTNVIAANIAGNSGCWRLRDPVIFTLEIPVNDIGLTVPFSVNGWSFGYYWLANGSLAVYKYTTTFNSAAYDLFNSLTDTVSISVNIKDTTSGEQTARIYPINGSTPIITTYLNGVLSSLAVVVTLMIQ